MKVPIFKVFWWKFAKFFKLFSKPEVSFSSNFAWLFSVMKDNFAVLFRVKHYVLCTRGTNESAICLDVWVLGSEFTKFLSVLKQEIVFFFQFLHHSSVPWDITLIYFQRLVVSNKYDLKNMLNFHPNTQTSKNFTSMGFFCPKYMRFKLKKYRGVIFYDTEQLCKTWINPHLVVLKMAWGIGWTFIRALKSLKNCTYDGLFLAKAYNVSVRIFQRNYVSWRWRMLQKLKENSLVAWKMT